MLHRFGEFVLDPESYTLSGPKGPVPIEPLVFDLIRYFVTHPQVVLSRDTLIEEVWRGRIVSDATISSAVKAARRALGDDGQAQALIRTIRGRGFQFIAKVEAELGPIDVLVNNAGITRDGMFHKMTRDQWDQVIGTNLNGLFNMTHPLWNGMRSRGFGRIINISSINGQKGQMGQANYSAAKAGDIGFTKALAQEGAFKGVTVNAICPGYVATDMVMAVPEKVRESIIAQIPVGRLGEPEDIARCVAFLASDDAGFITGATLTANGGQYLT